MGGIRGKRRHEESRSEFKDSKRRIDRATEIRFCWSWAVLKQADSNETKDSGGDRKNKMGLRGSCVQKQ